MLLDYDKVGLDWLVNEIDQLPDELPHMTPLQFNEEYRYLPAGASPRPGYIRFDLFPFWKEVIDCFDPLSPVREVNILKGVQQGYTTLLESIMFYYMFFIKSDPILYITADKQLATTRVENSVIPMIIQSGFADKIRSADEGNNKKTGKTKDFIQWEGGGFMIPMGAISAAKMRQNSAAVLLKDELAGWERTVGRDGNSDALTDDRASAYWDRRKILRGSTPLLHPCLMFEAYEKGDKRKYMVLCKHCSYPQELRQEHINEKTGLVGGFRWETEQDRLINESVRYLCISCGQEHTEKDKPHLFSEEHGAHWEPTAEPKEENVRSYHLPSFYSPYGFRPWYKCISDYLTSYDVKSKQVIDMGRYQKYYNNTLGMPFTHQGGKIRFISVSGHRRPEYKYGQIPNEHAEKFAGSKILFLTCHVDVHNKNLAVSVMGWTKGFRSYLIDYWRFEDEDCTQISSPVWQRLRKLIEDKVYESKTLEKYQIVLTLVDAGFANDTVNTFCSEYASGVYPSLGRDRPSRNQAFKEFAEYKTQLGTVGYRVLVDHYKDRLAPVLRRDWVEEAGEQKVHHFNAPIDATDAQLKELTVEYQREKVSRTGDTSYEWHRPGNARNELWDLLVSGHAAVEILAWTYCIRYFEQETVNWLDFWNFAESQENDKIFGRLPREAT